MLQTITVLHWHLWGKIQTYVQTDFSSQTSSFLLAFFCLAPWSHLNWKGVGGCSVFHWEFNPHRNTGPHPLPHLKHWWGGGESGSEIPIVSLLRFSTLLQKIFLGNAALPRLPWMHSSKILTWFEVHSQGGHSSPLLTSVEVYYSTEIRAVWGPDCISLQSPSNTLPGRALAISCNNANALLSLDPAKGRSKAERGWTPLLPLPFIPKQSWPAQTANHIKMRFCLNKRASSNCSVIAAF